jgi:hypothetical protein
MKKLFYILLIALLFTSCNEKKKNNIIEDKIMVQSTMMQTYQKADSLRKTGIIDTVLFNNFINQAISFANKYPEDETTPEILLNAGFSSMIMAKYTKETNPDDKISMVKFAKQGISIFNKIQKVYPDYEGVKFCYYNRGIIYDDILEDYPSADFEYREYINKYPNDSISNNLRDYLKFLGKSPDEIMSQIEKNNKAH